MPKLGVGAAYLVTRYRYLISVPNTLRYVNQPAGK